MSDRDADYIPITRHDVKVSVQRRLVSNGYNALHRFASALAESSVD
jgi:hypothetical protein